MDERLTHFCQPRASSSNVISCVQAVAAITSGTALSDKHIDSENVHSTSAKKQTLSVVRATANTILILTNQLINIMFSIEKS